MNIRVLFILLVISVLLTFSKRLRTAGLALSAVIGSLLLWFTVQQTLTVQTPEAAVASVASSTSVITELPVPTINLRLDGNGAPWRLVGNIQNTASVARRSVSLNLERFDCPTSDTGLADCVLLWQGQHDLRISMPAASTVKVDESFYSHGAVPRLTGVARDRITIIRVQ